MARSLVRLVPVLALATLALSACGGEDEKSARVVGKNAPEMCEYQHGDGAPAIMSYAGRTYRIDSGMFGKQYNRYDLEAVLGASGAETVRYAEAINIYLRRIPYNGTKNRCLYEEQIEVAPDNILDYWKQVSGGRLNNGEGGVDGLYTMFTSEGQRVQVILVRTSSDRWTLVHELMHANFHSSRIALGQPEGYDSEMKSTSTLLNFYLREYNSDKTESNLLRVAESYKTLGEHLRGTLINYALEEVADESVLVEEYAAGRLKNVPRNSVVNAAWYIKCSREKSLARLNTLKNSVRSDVMYPAMLSGWTSVQSVAQATIDAVETLDQRAQALATRAQQVSGATDADLQCNPLNREVQARLADENPHLVYMTDGNPSIRAFDKAMRDVRYTRSELAK